MSCALEAPAIPPMASLVSALAELDGPIGKRMRAIYYLRTLGSVEAIDALSVALRDKRNTVLVRHELAYVLGQIRNERACDVLESTLADGSDDAIVRHECAEALSAIGALRSLPLLEKLCDDPSIEVGETCVIARDYMLWLQAADGSVAPRVCACVTEFNSRDPAPADPAWDGVETAKVRSALLDASNSLFVRYGAMFALRNRGGAECARAIGDALVYDKTSALLRHEAAFVLGQLQDPAAIPALAASLRTVSEHSMVRHESAEALGAIEGDARQWARCEKLLKEFASDDDVVVRESCECALDAAEYWSDAAAAAAASEAALE